MGFIEKVAATVTGSILASVISKKYLTDKVEHNKDTILTEYQFPNTTILLPTLNEEWMVEKTLQSVKNQNIYKLYPNRIEILVIDSDSEDKTLEIAKNYANRIITNVERNIVTARSTGIENSRGDLIVFTDADTVYPHNWLNSMLKHYFQDPEIIAVSGQEFHHGINTIVDLYEPLFTDIVTSIGGQISMPMIGHNSSVYKWAYNMVEGFSVPFEYNAKNDTDTQMVLEKHFTEKLKTVGKYIYDPRLIAYDYGGTRRVFYERRKYLSNKENLTRDEMYLLKYWKERELGIRF